MKPPPEDAIAMLRADHKEIRALFEHFESLGDWVKARKRQVADRICRELWIHAEIEERIFYPAVGAVIQCVGLMDETLVKRAAARKLMAQISEMDADDDLYDVKVKLLSEQFEHHVRAEESALFPKVLRTNIDLKALGVRMADLREALTEKV